MTTIYIITGIILQKKKSVHPLINYPTHDSLELVSGSTRLRVEVFPLWDASLLQGTYTHMLKLAKPYVFGPQEESVAWKETPVTQRGSKNYTH